VDGAQVGRLKVLLLEEPTEASWALVCEALRGRPCEGDEVVEYALAHLEEWPAHLRLFDEAWAAEGPRDARWVAAGR
jgi:hypothetical protein